MQKFALDVLNRTLDLKSGQRIEIRVGPLSPGLVRLEIIEPEFLQSVAGVVFRPGPGATPPHPNQPPHNPINPNEFKIELIDAQEIVAAQDNGALRLDLVDVPTPGRGPMWTIAVTNNGPLDGLVSLVGEFRGARPIILRDIDLELINERLDQIVNIPQPFRFEFENRAVTESISGSDGRTYHVPATHTIFRIVADEEWSRVYSELALVERDLGTKLFPVLPQGSLVHVKATIHDGEFAFRLGVHFVNPGKVDLQEAVGGWSGLGGIAMGIFDFFGGPDFEFELNSLGFEAFFVLHGTQFEVIARPHIVARRELDEDPRGMATLLEIIFELLIERWLPSKIKATLEKLAVDVDGWIMGERGRTHAGSQETLSIAYVGDAPSRGRPHIINALTPLDPGNLSKIDHIVVIMMENRSFDHMLGFLSLPTMGNDGRIGLGRGDIDGLKGDESNPVSTASNLRQRVFSLATPRTSPLDSRYETRGTRFMLDPGHSYAATKRQLGNYEIVIPGAGISDLIRAGKTRPEDVPPALLHPENSTLRVGPNEGFVLDFFRRLGDQGLSAELQGLQRGEVMGYQPREHVPMYEFLATHYGVCDRWFASHPGHTWPNRFVSLTGALAPGPDGAPQLDNPPHLAEYDPLEVPTIFDHLSRAGIEWKCFEHDFCFLRLFSAYTFENERIRQVDDPVHGFFALAQNGRLPAVAFIEPDLTEPPGGCDDHPPADIQSGQRFIKRVYDALSGSPQWAKTVLLITYDEHGGFFDHVHPEARPSDPPFVSLADDPDTGDPIKHFGLRVPTFVVSPWVPASAVSNVQFDHTSILKTIMARFLPKSPPDMGPRVAVANDIGHLLSLSAPRAAVPSLPLVFKPDRRSRGLSTAKGNDDFRDFVTGFMAQIGLRK